MRKSIQDLKENINKKIENIKKNHSELKKITERKNTTKGVNSRQQEKEEIISVMVNRE